MNTRYFVNLDSHGDPVTLISGPSEQSGMTEITKQEFDSYELEIDIRNHGTPEFQGMTAKKMEFRAFREAQFTAFDIYKSNIFYGVINESQEQHEEVIEWYDYMLSFPERITEENYETIEFPETPAVIINYI